MAIIRLFLIQIILFLFLTTNGQITLNSNNFPTPGMSLLRFYCGTWVPDTINFVYTGDFQSCDFSGYGIFMSDTLNFPDATTTPFTNEHPGADVATFKPIDSVSYIYDYFSYNNNTYWESGLTYVADVDNNGTLDTIHGNHSDIDTLLSTEYTFGHNETETSLITLFINSLVYADLHKIKEIEVNGWGSLNTPFAFYDDALRIKYIEYKYDSVFDIFGTFYNAKLDTFYYYLFYAKDVRYPVVIAHFNNIGELQYVEIMKKQTFIYGCTDSSAINYNPLAQMDDGSCIYCNPISYTITQDTAICIGDAITLEVTGGNSYLWNTGETSSSITVQPSADEVYSVYIFDGNNCSEFATVEVTVYAPVQAGFWVTNNLQISDSALFVNTSTNATNYYWNFDDSVNGTSTEENPKHLYSSSGTKNIMLIAFNLCFSDTFNYTITISTVEEITSILTGLKVYPNPGENASIEFNLNKNANIDITISDLLGRNFHILKENSNSGKHKYFINTKDLNLQAGIYIIQINVDGRVYYNKWVKI
ncbi:MAG: T9SS type A sorting domain-containing protein [Bacteroidales bacterium]